jgi:aryl-alcohol dehydrogenase-like predicted oxidoreductase
MIFSQSVSTMRSVHLSGTDISTSRLGFGTSGLHHLLSSRRRQDLLAGAFAAGFRHFDTSPSYGHGIAERELGRFLRTRRSELSVATKFGVGANPWFARAPWLMYAQLAANAAQRRLSKRDSLILRPVRDFSAVGAIRSLDSSLRALAVDHVDILFLHDPNPLLIGQADALLSALERVRRDGKVRYIGLAGAIGECAEVIGRHPGIAQVIQVNATAGAEAADLLRNLRLPHQFSFGHFRSKGTSPDQLLNDAARWFPDGVLLYSTRRVERLESIAAALSRLETT